MPSPPPFSKGTECSVEEVKFPFLSCGTPNKGPLGSINDFEDLARYRDVLHDVSRDAIEGGLR